MGNLIKESRYSEISATLEVLGKHGVTRDDFKALRRNAKLSKKIAWQIISGVLESKGLYLLLVDYELSQHEMIREARLKFYYDDIAQNSVVGKGRKKFLAEIIQPERECTTDEMASWLATQEKDPAGLEHQLALAAQFPDVQKKFEIYALGTIWPDSSGHSRFPCLSWNDEGDGAFLRFFGQTHLWQPTDHLLVIHRKFK